MSAAPVCKRLIIITIVVFLAQIFLTRPPNEADFQDLVRYLPGEVAVTDAAREEFLEYAPRISIVEKWLQLETEKVIYGGQVWRLLTTAFCHDRLGVWHILINMLLLFWFGRTLETMYGSREFLIFYLTAAMLASLAFIALQLISGERNPAIGASGAVMAVVCLYTIHYPRHRILLFFIIPVEMRILLALYVIFDIHPVLLTLAGTPVATGVAHAAHLGGLAFGYAYWRFGWKLETIWNRITWGISRRLGPRRHLRVHQPVHETHSTGSDHFDAQVDDILAKISEHGEESLSDKERKLLVKASQRYRNRE